MTKQELQRTYRYRLMPTKEQELILVQFAGARRWVYNWGLQKKREYYQEHQKGLPTSQLEKELVALKKQPQTEWLAHMDSQSLQQALRDLDRSYANFFEHRARYPRFKSKHRDEPSFRIPQRVVVKDGTVYLPKVGWLLMKQHRPIEGKTKSATVKRDCTGHWHVMLVARLEMPDYRVPLTSPEEVAGIDKGLIDILVVSDGSVEAALGGDTGDAQEEKVASPRFYRRGEGKLRRAQRALSRKQKGSANRAKARVKLARVHRKVANRRHDFLHKQSIGLVRRYGALCIEDLSLKGMARTKHLGKSVNDAGLGAFRRMLEYKSVWHMKHLVVVDRWFASSKMCSVCGYKYERLGRDEREWVCAECGAHHDRDGNAARNIRREGVRLLGERGVLQPSNPTSLHTLNDNLNDNLKTNSPRDMGRVKTAVERASDSRWEQPSLKQQEAQVL